MACSSCGSENQQRFSVEMVIHSPGLKNLNKPPALAFPNLWICMDCSSKELVIPNSGGAFLGSIGSCVAVTDRNLTEAELEELSGRLITAQEEERTRIARELHDDFSQRMAIHGIGLEQLRDMLRPSEVKQRTKIQELFRETQEMSLDLHSLSHRLHSSRLEHVGLGSALRELCLEVSEKYLIQVEFAERGVSFKVPKDVALCLFRVGQEALGNVVKHSKAKRAQVELSAANDEIFLRVKDAGAGFDPVPRNAAAGIGHVGMSERLRLVGGALSIRSAPKQGTEILARVPLPVPVNEPRLRSQAAGGQNHETPTYTVGR